jgi:hypothetical protein
MMVEPSPSAMYVNSPHPRVAVVTGERIYIWERDCDVLSSVVDVNMPRGEIEGQTIHIKGEARSGHDNADDDGEFPQRPDITKFRFRVKFGLNNPMESN